ncbi:hypothetical protein [Planotetraspora sp. GP83]|uniref:hypothetical protein n=1 Tax=Planotetraspora sp. GP83 TaxID=3156264 RepID=UPI0035167FC3
MTAVTTSPVTDEQIAGYVHQAWQAADAARAEHLRRCTVRVAHLLRQHFPDAATATVDVAECIPRGSVPVTLLTIGEPGEVVWDADDHDIAWRLTQLEVDEIERLLFDALAFGVDHDVLKDAGWEQHRDDGDRYTVRLPDVPLATSPGDVVMWALRLDTGGEPGGSLTLHPSEERAVACLAIEVREAWYRVADLGDPSLPADPPQEDRQAIGVFFRAMAGRETYALQRVVIPAPLVAALSEVTVWVLHHDDDCRNTGEITVHASEQDGIAHLAGEVRKTWHLVADHNPNVPAEPPTDDTEAVRVYFAARSGEESYSLYWETLPGPARSASATSGPAPEGA